MGGYEQLVLATARGDVQARLYARGGEGAAAVCVGGVEGGFDSPARGLYDRLGAELPAEGVVVLRVRFRRATDLPAAVQDVRAGVAELVHRGVQRIGLAGHSFGGAAVISAAAREPAVRTVVALSTQAYGAEGAAELGDRALLLVHGTDDPILPAACSVHVHRLARGPKELHLVPGARHTLEEAADEVTDLVRGWLTHRLAP